MKTSVTLHIELSPDGSSRVAEIIASLVMLDPACSFGIEEHGDAKKDYPSFPDDLTHMPHPERRNRLQELSMAIVAVLTDYGPMEITELLRRTAGRHRISRGQVSYALTYAKTEELVHIHPATARVHLGPQP